jgi:hypothetical protein
VFEHGHNPDSRLPGMPRTAPGTLLDRSTLLDLICNRLQGEAVIKYQHSDGSNFVWQRSTVRRVGPRLLNGGCRCDAIRYTVTDAVEYGAWMRASVGLLGLPEEL